MSDARDLSDEERTIAAVHYLFTKSGEPGVRVLAWLMKASGWNVSLPPGASLEVMIDHNSGRRMFGTLYEILMSSDEGREALMTASRVVRTATE